MNTDENHSKDTKTPPQAIYATLPNQNDMNKSFRSDYVLRHVACGKSVGSLKIIENDDHINTTYNCTTHGEYSWDIGIVSRKTPASNSLYPQLDTEYVQCDSSSFCI